MKKILFTLLFLCTGYSLKGQNFVTELNGFMLGQWDDVPSNQLGAPVQEGEMPDDSKYQAFVLNKEMKTYIVFTFFAWNPSVIGAIQITGEDPLYDFGFYDLRLGNSTKLIKEMIGNPDAINDVGEYGKTWVYDDANFTLEIKNEQLKGVKIIDQSNLFFSDREKFQEVVARFNQERYYEALASGDHKAIAEMVSPDIEIYKDNSTMYFKHSMATEINEDKSGLFSTLANFSSVIESVELNDSTQFTTNIRLIPNQAPQWVDKFYHANDTSEIVYTYTFGDFRIYEVKIN